MTTMLNDSKNKYCFLKEKSFYTRTCRNTNLNEQEEAELYSALEKLENLLVTSDLRISDFCVELAYPRSLFSENIKKIVCDLTFEQRNFCLDNWGIQIAENGNLCGSPSVIKDNEQKAVLSKIYSGECVDSLNREIEKFINCNKVTVDRFVEISEVLNKIFKNFPELLMTVGKKQHATHDYTVDIHTLQVFQYIVQNPRIKELSEKEKRLFELAVLFHDLTKEEGTIDKTHPVCSAVSAYHILCRTGLTEDDKIFIYELIKNHHWLEKYGRALKSVLANAETDNTCEKAAFDRVVDNLSSDLSGGNVFLIELIFTEADLKSVKSNDVFYNKFKEELESGKSHISEKIRNINSK